MEEVLETMKTLMDKFDTLQKDVDLLKKPREAERVRNSRSRSRSRDVANPGSSRSRSRPRKRGREHRSRSRSSTPGRSRSPVSRRHKSWADRMDEDENELPDYEAEITFDDEDETPKLVEVSEKTKEFLEECCGRSLTNANRIKTRSRFPLPKVAATKTPQLDAFMKTEISSSTKALDKDLAKVQTFVLDSLAPLTAVVECDNQGGSLSHQEVMIAVKTAIQLIGNANAKISHLRREKVTSSLNKGLLPLVNEEEHFNKAAPQLFGQDFARKSKEFIDQVKAMRSTIVRPDQRQPFFRSGPPTRGGYNQRNWRGGNQYPRRGGRDRPFYPRKGYQNTSQIQQNKGRN